MGLSGAGLQEGIIVFAKKSKTPGPARTLLSEGAKVLSTKGTGKQILSNPDHHCYT